VTVQEISLSSF